MTTGEEEKEWCVECCPDDFKDDPRPKLFLPLCKKHLAEVEPLSEEAIQAAFDEGRKIYEEAMKHRPMFVPPRGYFR